MRPDLNEALGFVRDSLAVSLEISAKTIRGNEVENRTPMMGVGAPVTTRRTRTRDRWIAWDSAAFILVAAFVLIGIHGRTAYAWRVPEGRLGRAMKKAGVNAPEAALGSLEDDLTNYWWHGSRIPVGSNLMETYESFDACERECDAKGFACAGFKKDLTTDFCTLSRSRIGLQRAAESDFYRSVRSCRVEGARGENGCVSRSSRGARGNEIRD